MNFLIQEEQKQLLEQSKPLVLKKIFFNHSSGIFITLRQIGPNIRSKKPPITDAGIKVVWKNFILALKKVPKIRNKPNNPKEFNKIHKKFY